MHRVEQKMNPTELYFDKINVNIDVTVVYMLRRVRPLVSKESTPVYAWNSSWKFFSKIFGHVYHKLTYDKATSSLQTFTFI